MDQLNRTFRIVLLATALAAMLVLTIVNAEQASTRQRPSQTQVLNFETLTEQQFKQLPDSQLILFEGKQITLGEVRAKARARQLKMSQKRAAPRTKIVGGPARSSMDQLLRSQEQKFAAENTKVQTELKRLRQFGPATVHGQTRNKVGVSTQKQSGLKRLPQITKVLGIIQPGGIVLLGGINFGTTTAKVRMIVSANVELLLENLEWHPTGIGGRIPNDPTLVRGAGARFVVETSSGLQSNEWPVNWVIEVKQLPKQDVHVVSCSDDANGNWCNGSPSGGGGCTSVYGDWVLAPPETQNASLIGSHTNCWGAAGDDSGTDVYEIRLKNGWVLHEFDFGSGVSEEGEGWVTGPGIFPVGATSWRPSIAWSVTPSDTIAYWAFIYIRGPKGVPHK